ncbi:hypothetical protein C8R44DRAFT_804160 [Mycena epipterygia]|nr:hypothetical protein C8R44DRAFT_804160 [Mycena epipterygia]
MALSTTTLSKFPGVEVLVNGWPISDPDSHVEASGFLPVLREYAGTPKNLPFFHGIRITQNITSLAATFDDMDRTAFDGLCDLFTHLTELRVRVVLHVDEETADEDASAASFLKALGQNPSLPPTLEHLALSWEINSWWDEALSCTAAPSLTELRDALESRCPALTSLWIDGQDYLLRWRKFPDGMVDECTTYNKDDARFMREELGAFWNTRCNPSQFFG